MRWSSLLRQKPRRFSKTLARAGLCALACANVFALAEALREGAGAVLLTEVVSDTKTLEVLNTALAFGLLGVLLAVQILAEVITLVRKLYSYDALGLRKTRAKAVFSQAGRLQLFNAQQLTNAPPKQTSKKRFGRRKPNSDGQE